MTESTLVRAYTARHVGRKAIKELSGATLIETTGVWEGVSEGAAIVEFIVENDNPLAEAQIADFRRLVMLTASSLGEEAVYFTRQTVEADLAWTDQGYLEGGV